MHADIVSIACGPFHGVHFHAFYTHYFVMIHIAVQMNSDDLWPHASHVAKALWLLMSCGNVLSSVIYCSARRRATAVRTCHMTGLTHSLLHRDFELKTRFYICGCVQGLFTCVCLSEGLGKELVSCQRTPGDRCNPPEGHTSQRCLIKAEGLKDEKINE